MNAPTPDDPARSGEAHSRRPFLPLLLLAIAFVGWSAMQTTQLLGDHRALRDAAAQQVEPLAAAQKIRVAADSLAAKTQALADKGNADARAVVARLKERGVTINPNAKPIAPP
jgi:hypothetical protein